MTEISQATGRPARWSNPSHMVRRVGTVLVLTLAGCTASADEVRPPADQVFFPTGLAVSPDEGFLFVVSANSQLAYDSGTISVIDLEALDAHVDAWIASGTVPDLQCGNEDCCERDVSFPEIVQCDEEPFIKAGSGVRIGNFASTLAIQDKGGGDLRLVLPVRGDPSVTWIDWDAASETLSCGEAQGFPLCDEDHRLTRFHDDSSLPQIDNEPYGIHVDSPGEFAVVTHLTAGQVTLVDLPIDGTPVLADQLGSLFQSNQSGFLGTVGVASRAPGQPSNLVYVTALSESRVQTIAVERPSGRPPQLSPSAFFHLDSIASEAQASQDARAIAFTPGGDRAYVLNRLPPTVAVVDTSLDATGVPVNDVDGAVDICREAVGMVLADPGDGERAFVTCFQDGEMYVVDPRNGIFVEDVARIGRGPFGIAAAPGRGRIYISNFFEDTIAVVDIVPGSPYRYRVVLRIGIPRN